MPDIRADFVSPTLVWAALAGALGALASGCGDRDFPLNPIATARNDGSRVSLHMYVATDYTTLEGETIRTAGDEDGFFVLVDGGYAAFDGADPQRVTAREGASALFSLPAGTYDLDIIDQRRGRTDAGTHALELGITYDLVVYGSPGELEARALSNDVADVTEGAVQARVMNAVVTRDTGDVVGCTMPDSPVEPQRCDVLHRGLAYGEVWEREYGRGEYRIDLAIPAQGRSIGGELLGSAGYLDPLARDGQRLGALYALDAAHSLWMTESDALDPGAGGSDRQ